MPRPKKKKVKDKRTYSAQGAAKKLRGINKRNQGILDEMQHQLIYKDHFL